MTENIAATLVGSLRKSVRPGVVRLRDFVQGRPAARRLLAEVTSVERLIAGGQHPLHAAYTHAQNWLSVFSELSSKLREFEAFTTVVGDAEDTYVPGWPPMSPVSVSYFITWALLDVPIGPSGETLCSCAVELGRACGLSADFIATLEAMGGSGMGIYEHLGWQDGVLGLRDILDGRTHRCIVPSGHRGTKGELWYVRLLPPLDERFDHGVCFTSPYVLCDTTPADWFAFFERQERGLSPARTEHEQGVRRHAMLKRGPDPNYWNEYVFLAYSSASDSAIVLCGLPDLPQSLPHGRLARR
jgi:hypothetical protein